MTTINLKSFSRDINGNSIVKFAIHNRHTNSSVRLNARPIKTDKPSYGYSLQTSGNLPFTHSTKLLGKKVVDLDRWTREKIEDEIVNYLIRHGSDKQKFLVQ